MENSKNPPLSVIPQPEIGELVELCAKSPAGIIVELGTYKGGSAYAFNQVGRGRPLHLFDTFTGIPQQTQVAVDIIGVGAFADTSVDAIREFLPYAHFHVGLFPDTMPDDLPGIAFAFIDCDQYKSCVAAIERWWPLMVDGGIMAWDDYPLPGIKMAIHGFFKDVRFTAHNMPYAVKGETQTL